uniref:Vta1/callose synthase N-terminal domain-containing protein n=1 Tax=Strongyloides stercoralis TaxID=6248 RepID=A0A0K0E745_STRER
MDLQELFSKKLSNNESTYVKAHYIFFYCKEVSRDAIEQGNLSQAYFELNNSVNQFHEFMQAPDINSIERNQMRAWYMNLLFEKNELCLFAENKNINLFEQ